MMYLSASRAKVLLVITIVLCISINYILEEKHCLNLLRAAMKLTLTSRGLFVTYTLMYETPWLISPFNIPPCPALMTTSLN